MYIISNKYYGLLRIYSTPKNHNNFCFPIFCLSSALHLPVLPVLSQINNEAAGKVLTLSTFIFCILSKPGKKEVLL